MNGVPEIASQSHLKKMINNRDYSILINYSPQAQCFTSEYSNQTFSHDLRLLEIRAVLLSCIYYCARIVKELGGLNSDNETLKTEDLDQLNLHLEKLKYLYTQLESDPSTPVPIRVFGSFFGSKLFGLGKSKIMLTIFINFIELIQTMITTVNNPACMNDESINKMKVNTTELINGFEKAAVHYECIISKTIIEIDSSQKLEGRREVLETLSNMIYVSGINQYYINSVIK